MYPFATAQVEYNLTTMFIDLLVILQNVQHRIIYPCFVHSQPWSKIFPSLFDHMQTTSSYILSMHFRALLCQGRQKPFSVGFRYINDWLITSGKGQKGWILQKYFVIKQKSLKNENKLLKRQKPYWRSYTEPDVNTVKAAWLWKINSLKQ